MVYGPVAMVSIEWWWSSRVESQGLSYKAMPGQLVDGVTVPRLF